MTTDRNLALADRPKNANASVRAEGREFAGWTEVRISRSIEDAASSFGFSATSRWPGQDNPMQVLPDSACEVRIGTDRLITGAVDVLSPSYDAETHTNAVTGRSKTAQLVDCSALHEDPITRSAKSGRWRDVRLEDLAADLCAPYDVEVVTQADTGARLARFAIEDGETAFSALERAAATRAVLLTDDALGRLVLTRAGATRCRTALVASGDEANVLRCSASFDGAVRYSEYRCRGARSGSDLDFGDVLGSVGTALDDGLSRRRVLVIRPEKAADAAACRDRAIWEAAQRAGQSVQIGYAVAGWRQGNGDLWEPNAIVRVEDPIVGVHAELLIVSCDWTLDEGGGEITEMRVAPVGGYELLEPATRPRKITKGVGVWAALGAVGADALRRQGGK